MRIFDRAPSETRGLEMSRQTIDRARGYETPFFLLDRHVVAANYRAIEAATEAEVCYAVKANPHPAVLRTLADEGAGFEVASTAELRSVLELGVPPDRIVSSNPIKTPDFLRFAHAVGMQRMAFDSPEEIRKIARLAPSSRVYLRIVVDNSGSDWPLSRKHGAAPDEALPLLISAAEGGLDVRGITFHVGSQCTRLDSWRQALLTAARIWRDARAKGLPLEILNLGGGFPIQHLKPIPDVPEIGALIRRTITELFPPDVRIVVEPGRGLVGNAAALVASVIGKARRGEERWLYLDAGVFNGLMETIAGFAYEWRSERVGPTVPWTVAGPSCDSVDTMQSGVELPDLEVGDRVWALNAGAYTGAYASSFNGFDPPATVLVGD